MSKVRLILLVVGASAVVAGCGSSGDSDQGGSGQSDVEQVRAVGQEFYQSLLDGNYGEACSLFTDGGRRQVEDLAQQSEELRGSSCERILGLVTGASGREVLRQQVGEVDQWEVQVDGDSATITPPGGGQSNATDMVRQGDGWRISAQETGSG